MFVKMLDENTLNDRPQHKEENHAKIYEEKTKYYKSKLRKMAYFAS